MTILIKLNAGEKKAYIGNLLSFSYTETLVLHYRMVMTNLYLLVTITQL